MDVSTVHPRYAFIFVIILVIYSLKYKNGEGNGTNEGGNACIFDSKIYEKAASSPYFINQFPGGVGSDTRRSLHLVMPDWDDGDELHKAVVERYRQKSRLVSEYTPNFYTFANALYGNEHFPLIRNILNLPSTVAGESKLVVDVGANEGAITGYAAALGSPVIAFEAIPANIEILSKTIWANDWFAMNVVLIPHAVSDTAGKAVYFQNFGDSCVETQCNGQVIWGQKNDCPHDGYVRSLTTRIDHHVRQNVRLLKIDVEGSEYLGLLGASRLLDNYHVSFIHAEFAPASLYTHGKDPAELLSFLNSKGYEIYLADCSHNIDQEVINRFAHIAKCPVVAAESDQLVSDITAGNRRHHPQYLSPAKFQEFVNVLVHESKSPATMKRVQNCCLVNLLAYKSI